MNRRWPLNVLGLCLVLAFGMLGRWQLGREDGKRQQLAEAAAALAATPRPLSEALARDAGGIHRVQGRVRFTGTMRLLLDNQRRGSQVGVRLYCLARPDAAPALLVDLGWLPIAPDRTLPAADCPQGEHALAGLLVPPPSVGLRLGAGLALQPDQRSWLAMRLEPAEVTTAWQLSEPLSARVLRLDPALPLGFERDLELLGNTLPPQKHRGYAIQWFGLALATLVILVLLNLRRRR